MEKGHFRLQMEANSAKELGNLVACKKENSRQNNTSIMVILRIISLMEPALFKSSKIKLNILEYLLMVFSMIKMLFTNVKNILTRDNSKKERKMGKANLFKMKNLLIKI